MSTRQQGQEDCLACKATGSLTSGGLGAYAFRQGHLKQHTPSLAAPWTAPWTPKPLKGIGIGQLCFLGSLMLQLAEIVIRSFLTLRIGSLVCVIVPSFSSSTKTTPIDHLLPSITNASPYRRQLTSTPIPMCSFARLPLKVAQQAACRRSGHLLSSDLLCAASPQQTKSQVRVASLSLRHSCRCSNSIPEHVTARMFGKLPCAAHAPGTRDMYAASCTRGRHVPTTRRP